MFLTIYKMIKQLKQLNKTWEIKNNKANVAYETGRNQWIDQFLNGLYVHKI
jgi:hypothetical protein